MDIPINILISFEIEKFNFPVPEPFSGGVIKSIFNPTQFTIIDKYHPVASQYIHF